MNLLQTQFTTGRRKIFCYEDFITADNVKDVVKNGMITHMKNVEEIDKLFELYRGKDPAIEGRLRDGMNEDINYKAFVSYYSLIADYKANLFMQNPVVFVNADGEELVSNELIKYGKIHRNVNKYEKDKTTAFHASICGVAWRFIEYDKETVIRDSVLNPKNVFSLYGDDSDDRSMAKVYITQVMDSDARAVNDITEENAAVVNLLTKKRYHVYTDTHLFEWVDGDEDVKSSELLYGCPIVEYRLNPFYIGSFERVVSLIHLLSVLRSDGVNGVVQSVAGVLLGKNIGVPQHKVGDTEEQTKQKEKIMEEFREQLKTYRQIYVEDSKDKQTSIEYIATELYNADIDVLYNGIVQDIVTITRIPNSTMNIGGSGNAGAARQASGVEQAMEDAKNAEPYWFASLREQTKIELRMAHYKDELMELNPGDIDFAMQRLMISDPINQTQSYKTLVDSGVRISDASRITGIAIDPEEFERRTKDNIRELEERKIEIERELNQAKTPTVEVIDYEGEKDGDTTSK